MDFNEEVFLNFYGDKLKKYMKNQISLKLVKNNVFELDIADFLKNYSELCDINEHIIENPKLVEDPLLHIFKEAYTELFGEDEHIKKDLEKMQIAFKNPLSCDKKIDEITSSEMNKLVKFEGNIIKAAKVCALLKKACFVCRACGSLHYKTIHDYFETPRSYCKNQNCRSEMTIDYDSSSYVNIQELEIQQPIDLMKNPDDPPRSIRVFLENSDGIYSGRVDVVGTVMKKMTRPNMPVFEIYTKSNHVKLGENFQKIEVRDIINNYELIDTLNELGKKENIIDILSNYLIPQIKGYDVVKKAIFLQQVKGCIKYLPDGSELRKDSHILLITDPGIGKSTMLRKISRLFPQNSYASVTTATGGGLTANVVREATEIGDGWVVKPGVFVRANEGTACIDELTVDKNVMKYILEAMESQTIHVNKGGINVKLPAKCAVLAACNPKRGRFDRNMGVVEQIGIPAPLLSRFDLIFPLKDLPDRRRDLDIAEHILEMHVETATKKYTKVLGSIDIDGIKVDENIIKNYIIYARTCAYFDDNHHLYSGEVDEKKLKSPSLSENAKKLIKEYYVNMRKLGEGDNPVPVTARQLEAAIRISEMHAKARLSKKVEEKDAKIAIDIIEECLKQIAYDPETGKFDIDKGMGEIPKSKLDKMDRILAIIRELSVISDTGLADEDDILERALEFQISEKDVHDLLEKLKKSADVFSPKYGYYRLT
ncbi:MCM family protein [Methanococcus vannielii SB]|uniref:MCM family protein n=1 Tax=Methanococcus vannielii (strain ATCC 35089 / DSM 1224 / JCM 13029 / OCM 148 / SB) TaxID=406327 RepID=A6UP35_METVS|nr:minichromosome maintenance protein MCM [Methanococcus vannielii]ABR54257.1 MCM family protein [Methanococcus vannielii SB]